VEKEWWQGSAQGERLLDFALPHEDHEEPSDPSFRAGPFSAFAALLSAAGILVLVVSTVVVAAHDMI
jgi:hypothetical protein